MKTKETIHIIMALVFAAAVIPALLTASSMVFAQISPNPTSTWTISPETATSTPLFTPTETSPPPTNTPPPPTNTPPPPTSTPAPLPPPTLGSFSIVPLEGVAQVNTDFAFTMVFTDPDGIINPGFATFFWGDGDTSTCPLDTAACTIVLGAASADQVTSSPTFTVGEVQGNHAYSEPGVYTVQLTLRDEFGQFDTATFEFVTVFDPSGGFVTGGGWIDSPAGAYKPDPDLAGKASFGFVSKYKKGASVPTGQTEFQFQVADLNFHSDSYQWLVVNQNQSRAQFKGEGTINGALDPSGKNYQFMIWATDGSPDIFRIKIWYMDGDTMVVVYDNGVAQAIGGGSIVVHGAKQNSR